MSLSITSTQDARVIEWVGNKLRVDNRLDACFNPSTSLAFMVGDGDELLCVLLAHNFRPELALELSIVSTSPRWASRKVLRYIFDYCFNTANVKRVYTQASSFNEKALDMNRRLGFEEMAVLPDFSYDLDNSPYDVHVFSMTRDNCKWVQKAKAP